MRRRPQSNDSASITIGVPMGFGQGSITVALSLAYLNRQHVLALKPQWVPALGKRLVLFFLAPPHDTTLHTAAPLSRR